MSTPSGFDLSQLPVLRAGAALGPVGVARVAALASLVASAVVVLAVWRPDLLWPSDIGSDTSNYLAAGLRLVDGSSLYELSAGDRPVPADNPPLWSAPLLSPPPIALLWAVPALVAPSATAMHLWWLIGLVGTALTAATALASPRPAWLALLFLLAPAIALTAASGNVNAWLVPAMALVWLLARRRQTPAVIVLLALLAGTSAAVKLGPVLVIWWLFVQGRPKAAIAATGIAAILGAASVLVAGPESFEAYLRLSAETATAGATRLSATALALNLGVPYELATYAPIACLSLAALSILGLRRRSHLAFFVALLGGVLATPVVRFESFAVLAAAGAATVSVMPQPDVRPSRQVLVRAGAVLGMLGAIGFVSWTASSTRSSLVIENRIDTPIVVRVGAVAQSATFGFRVDPKSAVRGYRLLDGGLPGLITVLVPGCGVLGTILPPAAGGHLVVEEANVVSISADLGSAVPLAAYVSDCADWPSGVGGDPR